MDYLTNSVNTEDKEGTKKSHIENKEHSWKEILNNNKL